MGNQVEHEPSKSDLLTPWIIVGMMLTMLAAYITVCHVIGEQLQQPLPEDRRILFRTILYAVAIVTFPLTNLIRHIQLRLNQTMPRQPSAGTVATAKSRYLVTIIVSMSLVELVGIFGLLMFIWGDGFNTLYIFTGLSALGLFLYRPKLDEYLNIIDAIAAQKHE
ncbi:MAG: hypothetical protein ACXWF8_05910 [Methylobacter sp.]